MLDALIGEFFTLITTTWTEISAPPAVPQRLFTSVQGALRSVVEQIKDGRIVLPAVVLEIGDFIPDETWGATNKAERAPVAVYYIGSVGAVSQGAVEAKLRLLQAAVDGAAHTNFQAIELGAIDTSEMAIVNQTLLAESKARVVGGSVRWQPGVLVFPHG